MHLPDPPPLWRETYPSIADGLTETAHSLDTALELLRAFGEETVTDITGTEF